jgi:hypothetical protein
MGQIKKDMTEVKKKRLIDSTPLLIKSEKCEKKHFTCTLKNQHTVAL